eukprot:gene27779-33553_t
MRTLLLYLTYFALIAKAFAFNRPIAYRSFGGVNRVLWDSVGPRENLVQRLRSALKPAIALTLLIGSIQLDFSVDAKVPPIVPTPEKGYQTKSGLRYFDLEEGKGVSPKFGQIISFQYTIYFQAAPDSPLEIISSTLTDSDDNPFLHKHGNGRLIRGVDEALHTMKVGGKRRVFVPKNMGYVDVALGPVPVQPGPRRKLNKVLDLVEEGQGRLVFDLELVAVIEDENDLGYYDDIPVSDEEMIEIFEKVRAATEERERSLQQ